MAEDLDYVITVSQLTKRIVAEIAPHELSTLDTYLAAYDADPAVVRRFNRAAHDEATGLGTIGTTLTPYVLGVVSSTLTFLSAQFVDAVRAETGNRIRRGVARLFARTLDRSPAIVSAERVRSLTPAQLEEVRAAAYAKALDLRLAESTAKTLADAVIGSLVRSGE